MSFESPVWLYVAPLVALLATALIAYGLKQRESLLGRFAASRLLQSLTEKANLSRSLIKSALIVIAIALIPIAIARPQWGVEWSERKARGLDIVFVLDSSKSMLATDLRPNRLARAKLAILDLVERLESDRIGLVAFAGQAFLQTPPTLDYSAFRESLEAVGPDVMTRGGSDIGTALREATKAFPPDNNYKVVVLLTDGEDLGGGAIQAVESAGEGGITVYAIGIGTPEGEYLRIKNENGEDEFLRDASGQPVRSQLDESTLQEIALKTGGSYSRLSGDSLEALFTSVIATLPRSERESEMQERPIERYQWLLSFACLFIVLEILIRRRKVVFQANLLLLGVGSIFLFPPKASAQELETTQEDTAPLPLELNEALEPETTPTGPVDSSAITLYNEALELATQQKFETANSQFEAAITASDADLRLQRDALYNAAHNHFQLGETAFQSRDFKTAIDQWKVAEAKFRSANEVDPKDLRALEDAELVEARRKALEEFLQQQQDQQEQQQDEQNEEQESDDSEESEQEQESGESGDEGEQDEGEQEQSEGEQGDSENSEEQQESESSEGSDRDEEPNENAFDNQDQEREGDESEQEQSSGPSEEDPTSEEESQPLPERGEGQDEEAPQETPAPSPQANEEPEGDEATDAGSAAASPSVPIEGMTELEAQALLDSLMNNEQLLPFIGQGDPQSRNTQDW